MPKITLNNIGTLEDNSALASLNQNFQTIVDEFDNVPSRDGTSPSAMTSDLDMNSNQILNLPDATTDQEPLTYGQFNVYYADIVSKASQVTSDKNAVESLYDQFDDRYLGSKAVAPSVDNDGGSLLEGAMYWNSVSNSLNIYDGSSWSPYLPSTSVIDSVNGQVGTVVLDADDIDDTSTTNKFATASDISKLAGIEASADVTNATNVEAAGALMDSELTSEASVKAINQGLATTDSPSFASITANVSINTQTGTTYTLALTDKCKIVEMNNSSANTVTVPPNSSVAFPVGSKVDIVQYGSGTTTIAAGSGVTLRSKGSALDIGNQYSAVTLYKRATDEWVVVGDLV